jgi:hypothetical protein
MGPLLALVLVWEEIVHCLVLLQDLEHTPHYNQLLCFHSSLILLLRLCRVIVDKNCSSVIQVTWT